MNGFSKQLHSTFTSSHISCATITITMAAPAVSQLNTLNPIEARRDAIGDAHPIRYPRTSTTEANKILNRTLHDTEHREYKLINSQRSAALKLDWTKLATQLGLKGSTANALVAFKKRNDDARRKVAQLSEQSSTVDFAHYRGILKNQSIIDDIEKQFKAFKPATYDVERQIKAIEAFEAQAVQSAQETKSVVDQELKDLDKTLKNIEEARPFEDLTVVSIGIADLSKCWTNGAFRTMLLPRDRISTNAPNSSFPSTAGEFLGTRRGSATCQCCKLGINPFLDFYQKLYYVHIVPS
jgi:F-type H+-transporting ATPase subunit d